jgi:hypothetical protein
VIFAQTLRTPRGDLEQSRNNSVMHNTSTFSKQQLGRLERNLTGLTRNRATNHESFHESDVKLRYNNTLK